MDTAESRDQRESSPRPRVTKPLRTDIRTRPYYEDIPYDPPYEQRYEASSYDPYYEPAGYRRFVFIIKLICWILLIISTIKIINQITSTNIVTFNNEFIKIETKINDNLIGDKVYAATVI